MPVELVCTLALFWGQTSADVPIRLPPESEPIVGAEATARPASFADPLLDPQLPAPLIDERATADGRDWPDGIEAGPATRMTATWLAGSGRNAFGTLDLDLNRTWFIPCGAECEPLSVTPGFGMHFWSGPQTLHLPPRVYDLYLDFAWQAWQDERSGLAVGITPGFYGDFETLDRHTFQLTGYLLGNYRLSPEWNVVGGLAYVRQLQSNLLPVGGLVWTPSEDMQVDLLIPRPRFARRVRSDELGDVWWYIAGQFGGGAWAVADSPDRNVLVGYSDFRLLLGVQSFHVSGREFSWEIGYVFARDISVNDVTVREPDNTFVLQGSLAF